MTIDRAGGILAFIREAGQRRWSELEQEFVESKGWPKATFVKYFKILQNEKKVVKKLGEDGRVYYCVDRDYEHLADHALVRIAVGKSRKIEIGYKTREEVVQKFRKKIQKSHLSPEFVRSGPMIARNLLFSLKVFVEGYGMDRIQEENAAEALITLLLPLLRTTSMDDYGNTKMVRTTIIFQYIWGPLPIRKVTGVPS